jgi:hypothetical protein
VVFFPVLVSVARRRVLLTVVATAAVLFGAGPALAEGKLPPGDPPGNNGTIKVVASDPSDPDPGNEPQLNSCVVWIEFYGFDQGQVADVTFSAQPPSGDKQLVLATPAGGNPGTTWTGTISADPAGGGQDDDAVISFNLTSGLEGLERHPQQGYHIKVASNTHGAPGGSKTKVFWLNCTPEAPGTLTVTMAAAGNANPSTFDLVCNHALLNRTFTLRAGESTTVDGVPANTACVVTGGASEPRAVRVGSAATTTVEVLGIQLTQPEAATTLPRTGTQARDLAVSAAGMAVFGFALRRMSRRSESAT